MHQAGVQEGSAQRVMQAMRWADVVDEVGAPFEVDEACVQYEVQGGAVDGVKEATRALAMSEGLTLEHIDALRDALCRKMATFIVAEVGSSGNSTSEAIGSVRRVATAAPRTSRSAVGGRRR